MNAFADMSREISGLLAHRAPKVEIKTGSLSLFAAEISRNIGLRPADHKDVSSMTFSGVPVVESDLIPANMAVIMSGGQIVQILRFADQPNNREVR